MNIIISQRLVEIAAKQQKKENQPVLPNVEVYLKNTKSSRNFDKKHKKNSSVKKQKRNVLEEKPYFSPIKKAGRVPGAIIRFKDPKLHDKVMVSIEGNRFIKNGDL